MTAIGFARGDIIVPLSDIRRTRQSLHGVGAFADFGNGSNGDRETTISATRPCIGGNPPTVTGTVCGFERLEAADCTNLVRCEPCPNKPSA